MKFTDTIRDGDTKGAVIVSKYVLEDGFDVQMANIRAARDGYWFARLEPGEYIRLNQGPRLWMSTTPMEIRTNQEFAKNAKGDVLVFGLGLGLMFDLINWDNITSITIVEINQDIIDLIFPYIVAYHFPKPINIVHGDAYKYTTESKFDVVYFDIWHDICTDNWEDMEELRRIGLDWLKPNGWVGCWLDKELREMLFCRACEERKDDCGCDRCWMCEELIEDCGCDRCDECNELEDDCGCDRCDNCGELLLYGCGCEEE